MQEYSKIIQCKFSQIKMQTLMLEKNYVLIRVFYDKWLIKKNYLVFIPIKLIAINLFAVPINVTNT